MNVLLHLRPISFTVLISYQTYAISHIRMTLKNFGHKIWPAAILVVSCAQFFNHTLNLLFSLSLSAVPLVLELTIPLSLLFSITHFQTNKLHHLTTVYLVDTCNLLSAAIYSPWSMVNTSVRATDVCCLSDATFGS